MLYMYLSFFDNYYCFLDVLFFDVWYLDDDDEVVMFVWLIYCISMIVYLDDVIMF